MSNALAGFARRYAIPLLWPWYILGFFALAATNIITLEIPQLAKEVVNVISNQGFQNPGPGAAAQWDRLPTIAMLIIALGVLQVLIRSLSRILVFWPGRTIEARCRTDAFNHLLTLPQRALYHFGMGDLISRLANDIGQLRVFFAFGLLQVLNLGFLSAFIISRMALIHVGLTLACLAPITLMLVITRFAMPKLQDYSRQNQEATGRLTNKVTEAFVNVHVVQQSGAAESFLERTRPENEAVYQTNMKLVFIRNAVFPLMSCLASVGQMTVIFYGGYEAIAGRLSVGDILAFNVYIGFLSFPLTAVGMIIAMYERARTAVIRLNEIEDVASEAPAIRESFTLTQEPAETAYASPGSSPIPVISVRNLAFRYKDDAARFGLDGISFDLRPGQRIGIAGPVGSGKTTLLQLLVRLYDPPAGTVFLNGKDVLSMDPFDIRRQCGMAAQTVHLFSDTVEQNLRFGLDHEPSQAEIERATAEAMLLEEIHGLQNGFQTEIGEKGIRLSGGQKQRLALARLFLREYEVLLLDDVLSAVDQITEVRLVENLVRRGCAIIVASHRPSVLRACDWIVLLDQGRIKTSGTWDQVKDQIGNLAESSDQPGTDEAQP